MGLIARILRRRRQRVTTDEWVRADWRHPNGTDPDCPWCAAMGNRGRR